MNYIITEEQLKLLTKNISLLNEQNQSIVPELAIDAISKIESIYGHMENGKVVGYPYTGREKLSVMENYIKDTIGFDCWNSLSDKFKSQIYGFCFQADTDVPYKFKFIAGLANAIDSSVDRSKIVGKGINNNNVKNAILLIKNNCNRLNGLYESYLKIVDQQYKSMDYNNNYEFIWKYRPTAIDRILSGVDVSKVLNDWKESFNSSSTNFKKTVDKSGGSQTNSNSLDDYTGVYVGKDAEGKENKTELTKKDNKLFSEVKQYGTKIKVYLTQTTQKDVFNVEAESVGIKSSSGTAKFNKNGVGDVCSASINATAELTWAASKIAKKDKVTVNLVGQKEGVSCDAQPEQKPVKPTTSQQPEQKPVKPTTSQQPEQKPVKPTTSQQPEKNTTGPQVKRITTRV